MSIRTPQSITTELAEETGWHIGDGSMNFYKNKEAIKGFYQLRGHFADDKLHYTNRIKPLFKDIYNINVNLREMPSTKVFGFQIWNNELVNFKRKIGLPLGKKLDISIPSVFLKDKALKIAVVRGVFDTDGCIYLEKKNNRLYPRVMIRTISKKLGEQLVEILKEAGFRATIYSELFNKELNRQRVYIISIRGVEMFHKFMEDIEPKNQKHILKYKSFISSKSL